MDLKLEKEALLSARGVSPAEIDTFHFIDIPEGETEVPLTRRMEAVCEAIHHMAANTDLLPVGMGIGPFSLMTKLISDSITPVFLASEGATARDEEEVAMVEIAGDVGENHPFILGSECDVLSVPGYEQTIKAKVEEFLKA